LTGLAMPAGRRAQYLVGFQLHRQFVDVPAD
jgi:hypothetical protein